MNFDNRLKGSTTQNLLETLLKDAGYNVVPLGIEEVIREAQGLSAEEYSNLNLSPTLRKLPDFFVASKEFKSNFLVEVKYRKSWNLSIRSELEKMLLDQVKQWEPVYLVLFLGEKAGEKETPMNYLGVCKLVIKDSKLCIAIKINTGDLFESRYEDKFVPWSECKWSHFNRFQDVFIDTNGGFKDSTITKAIELVKSLNLILDDSL